MANQLIADDDAELPAQGSQTFAFGKRVFVSGLFWQPLPGSTARQRKAEMQKMAEEQGFDLAVQRTSGVPQAGFASLADGIKPGMLSVAAMVSKSLEVANRDRSFLCAMPVPGGRWLYVAQREGVLLHDGDILGAEDAIRTRMMTDLSLTEWQTVFAPKSWGVPDSIERRFEDLLPKTGDKYSFKSWWEIRPIRNTWLDFFQDNTALYVALIFLLLTVGGFYGYQQWKMKQELEELARLEAAEQAAREAAAAEQPWKKTPRAAVFVAACNEALAQVKTFWPGNWTPSEVVCKNRALTIQWTRQPNGWIEHLTELEPRAEFSADGAQAMLSIPLKVGAGEADTLPRQRQRIIQLLGVAQRHGLGLSIKPKSGGAPLGSPAAASSGWIELDWSINDSLLSPETILPLIDSEGFRVRQIKLSFAGGNMNWTMEGTQYVQP